MNNLFKKANQACRKGLWVLLASLLSISPAAMAGEFPPLPEGLASFGAAVAGDDLVVYGGHVGKTHQHSVENLSHRFLSLDLTAPEKGWQSLAKVEGLQGLPMVAHGRDVCRVGGLRALNHVGSEEDLHSTDVVRCFNLDTRRWRDLPPLPQARSSHDAVVFEDHLYVVGGWNLRGADQSAVWQDELAYLDLRKDGASWQTVDQPFQRRALAVAAAEGKVYAFGGLGQDGTSRGTEIYNISTGEWSKGEDIPPMGDGLKGFGVSAFAVGSRIYITGGDGIVHALEATADHWETRMGKLETARFFHRLLPYDGHLLFVAGASRSGHLDDLEVLPISTLRPGSIKDESSRSVAAAASWPGFRGQGNSHAVSAELPLQWSDEENISWRVRVPGYGQSAPVVWDGQVFVTSVEGANKETLILSSLSLEDGAVRWRRRFDASQEIESSDMVSRGAPTPVVDRDRVYAFFESGDLIALSHDGDTLWQRSLTDDYGEFAGNHGVASSPVLTREAVVVQVTHDGPSYFLALEKETGVDYWMVEREAGVAWTTPVVVSGKMGEEIISSAAGRVEGLDASTGERLWFREGIEKNHVPSVTVDRGLVIVASSDAGHNFALDRLGQGELDDQHIAWKTEGVTSGFASPVVQGECVLFVNKAGVVTCVDRTKGESTWKHRLAEACWANPIVSGERVYFFTKKGQTIVLASDESGPQVLAESTLTTEGTVYGVAAAHDAFFVRTGSQVIKIAGPPDSLVAVREAPGQPDEGANGAL